MIKNSLLISMTSVSLLFVVLFMPMTVRAVVIEAEDGQLFGVFEIGEDINASGGQYVHVPNGGGNSNSSANASNRVDFEFAASQAGLYRVDANIFADTVVNDSFHVGFDNQPENAVLWNNLSPNTSYSLDSVASTPTGEDPVLFDLSAGTHILSFYLREDGTRLDRVELVLVEGAGGNTAPVLSSLGDQINIEGATVNLAISASDADGDLLTYSVDADTLPPGLSFNDNQSAPAIIGTPTVPGEYNTVITVSDGNGGGNNLSFRWTINSQNGSPGGNDHLILTGLQDSGPITLNSSSSNQIISNLRISNPSGNCITINGAQNITIENVELGPCRRYGLRLDNVSNITLNNVIIHDIEHTGDPLRQAEPEGSCIWATDSANITVNNSEIYGCGSFGIRAFNSSGVSISTSYIHDIFRNAVYTEHSDHITVDHNRIENAMSGAQFAFNPQEGAIGHYVFTNNFVKNVHRRRHTGNSNGGNVVQLNTVSGPGIRINNNIAINESSFSECGSSSEDQINISNIQFNECLVSDPEDLVSIFKSSGLPNDRVQINNNRFFGGGPATSSGGIILGDQGGSHLIAENNILVHPGQYGIQIAGGRFNTFNKNKIYSDNTRYFTNAGLLVVNYERDRNSSNPFIEPCNNIVITENEITFWLGENFRGRGNITRPFPAYIVRNDRQFAPNSFCELDGEATNIFDGTGMHLDESIFEDADCTGITGNLSCFEPPRLFD